jgi:hypothetical protein
VEKLTKLFFALASAALIVLKRSQGEETDVFGAFKWEEVGIDRTKAALWLNHIPHEEGETKRSPKSSLVTSASRAIDCISFRSLDSCRLCRLCRGSARCFDECKKLLNYSAR